MRSIWVALGIAAISLTLQSFGEDQLSGAEYYVTDVKPIFQTNCYRCHGGINRQGRFNLETKAGMFRGGRDGAVVLPGDAADSPLLKLIRHEGPAKHPMPMPPKSKLSDRDIAVVARWINAGAIMPDDPPKRVLPESFTVLLFERLSDGFWTACGQLCG